MAETSGVSSLSSIGGALGGTVISSLIGGAFASSDAKKQRQMEEELGKLSLAQQKELELNLQSIRGELAKQEIVYKYLAVQRNNEALAKIQGTRYISYIVLGGGIMLLTVVVFLLGRKRKN